MEREMKNHLWNWIPKKKPKTFLQLKTRTLRTQWLFTDYCCCNENFDHLQVGIILLFDVRLNELRKLLNIWFGG